VLLRATTSSADAARNTRVTTLSAAAQLGRAYDDSAGASLNGDTDETRL